MPNIGQYKEPYHKFVLIYHVLRVVLYSCMCRIPRYMQNKQIDIPRLFLHMLISVRPHCHFIAFVEVYER